MNINKYYPFIPSNYLLQRVDHILERQNFHFTCSINRLLCVKRAKKLAFIRVWASSTIGKTNLLLTYRRLITYFALTITYYI